MDIIAAVLDSPVFLVAWIAQAAVALGLLIRDLAGPNAGTKGLMRWVWILSVAYSGLIGLWIYWSSGRPLIPDDADWRRGARSTAHCYSGCGMGEIIGVILAVGILGLPDGPTAAITFTFAYLFGLALTIGPLMQEGIGLPTATKDAIISETASIVVMEAVAIGVDLYLAGEAGLGDIRFWSALIVSLSIGFFAAWPVNILLIRLSVKEGMHDPREHAG